MTLLLTYVGFALGVSFLCSLLEASLLSSRIVWLTKQRDEGHRGAAQLAVQGPELADAVRGVEPELQPVKTAKC